MCNAVSPNVFRHSRSFHTMNDLLFLTLNPWNSADSGLTSLIITRFFTISLLLRLMMSLLFILPWNHLDHAHHICVNHLKHLTYCYHLSFAGILLRGTLCHPVFVMLLLFYPLNIFSNLSTWRVSCLERPFCANFLYLISFICFYILYCILFYFFYLCRERFDDDLLR
jgi:hypothetical protein